MPRAPLLYVWFIALLGGTLASCPRARAGTLRTRDGRTFVGELRLGDDTVVVAPAGVKGGAGPEPAASISAPLAEVKQAVFAAAPAGASAGGTLAGGWQIKDVGYIGAGCLANCDPAGKRITVLAAGTDVRERGDNCGYVYQRLPGDGELTARVVSLDPTLPGARAGLMIRENLWGNARGASVLLSARGPLRWVCRKQTSEVADAVDVADAPGGAAIRSPYWLKVARKGRACTLACSADGKAWRALGSETIDFASPSLYIGFAVTSGRPYDRAAAVFDGAELLASGLRGEYFAGPDFRDRKLVRVDGPIQFAWGGVSPDPAVPSQEFSATWSGQIEAPLSEAFTFTLRADEAARLWVDHQLLVSTNWAGQRNENKPFAFEAGRKYDLKLDYYKRTGPASLRLAWASRSRPVETVPANAFSWKPDPAAAMPEEPQAVERARTVAVPSAAPGASDRPVAAAAAPGPALPALVKGVQTVGGSFIAGSAAGYNEETATFPFIYKGTQRSIPFKAATVAKVFYVPLPPDLLSHLPDKSPGVLLKRGDFVEGDFKGIENRYRIQISSVLLGLTNFVPGEEAVALVLRPPDPTHARFVVRTTSGSVFLAKLCRLEKGELIVEDPYAGVFHLSTNELLDLTVVEAE